MALKNTIDPYDQEEEMETVYVYVYDEDPEQPSPVQQPWDRVAAFAVQLLAVVLLAMLCLAPSLPVYSIKVLRVPARFLPLHVYQVQRLIVPTGTLVHPATDAHGVLTVYNGSILTERLPAGFLVTSQSGVEVETDQAVMIPAANPPTEGMATVAAHAVIAGSAGNLAVGSITQADGTSLVIKNLSAFTGGQDASTERVVTSDDVAKARDQARNQLAALIPIGLLAGPCAEATRQNTTVLSVTWSCRYVAYTVPAGVQVVSVRLDGRYVMVQIKVLVQA